MKIASNKLIELYKYYQSELLDIYDESELYAIFELVCEHYLSIIKSDLRKKLNDNINQSDVLHLYLLVKELKSQKPIQYILQESWFYNLKFKVTSATLIPRPETEELVNLIIQDISKQQKETNTQTKIIDIGTGSACIPITLKKHLPTAHLVGLDVSEKALEIAKYNARQHNAEVEFLLQDVLSNKCSFQSPFSVIVSNPPYVKKTESREMDPRVLNYEPHIALFVEDEDAIVFYKRIIDLCKQHLISNGFLYFELNPQTANAVKSYADDSNLFTFTEVLNDMSGKGRFFKAKRK